MPATDRNQTAVLWPTTGYGNDGQPTLGTAREISVRWIDTRQLAKDAKGEVIKVMASVTVGEDIEIGSVMWLGTLADWVDSGGVGSDRLGEVVVFRKTPDLKARIFNRKVQLQYYKGSFTG